MRRLAAAAFAAASIVILPTAASAHDSWFGGTSGDGHKVTQSRSVASFNAVRVEGSIDCAIRVGGAQAVSITIDQNLQPLIATEVSGDTLIIRNENVSWHGKGIVEITVPELRGVTIKGSADVTVDGGKGDLALRIDGSGDLRWSGTAGKLEASISGSGDLRLSGTAEQVRISVAGSGDVKAADLTARSAEISVAGSGDVEVTLDGGTLQASVAGSGDVVWHGRATVERSVVAGSGSVVRR